MEKLKVSVESFKTQMTAMYNGCSHTISFDGVRIIDESIYSIYDFKMDNGDFSSAEVEELIQYDIDSFVENLNIPPDADGMDNLKEELREMYDRLSVNFYKEELDALKSY